MDVGWEEVANERQEIGDEYKDPDNKENSQGLQRTVSREPQSSVG